VVNTVTVLAICVGAVQCAFLLIVVRMLGTNLIRASTPQFLCTFLLSSAALALGSIAYIVEPDSSAVCNLRAIFTAVPLCFMLVSLFIKSQRVASVFSGTLHSKSLSLRSLYVWTSSVLAVEVVLVVVFIARGMAQPSHVVVTVDSQLGYVSYCEGTSEFRVWFPVQLAWFALLLAWGLLVSLRTRNVPFGECQKPSVILIRVVSFQ